MTQIADLQDRLRRLAKRREAEGIYTDAAICEEAATALESQAAELAAYRRRNGELETIAQKLVSANIRERVLQDKLERAEVQRDEMWQRLTTLRAAHAFLEGGE